MSLLTLSVLLDAVQRFSMDADILAEFVHLERDPSPRYILIYTTCVSSFGISCTLTAPQSSRDHREYLEMYGDYCPSVR